MKLRNEQISRANENTVVKQGLTNIADELDLEAHNANRSSKHQIKTIIQPQPVIQPHVQLATQRRKIMNNVIAPKEHRDYLAHSQNFFTNTSSFEHQQNQLHQNRHGQQSLSMGVPDHIYQQVVGEQIGNSNPAKAPSSRIVPHKARPQHDINQPQNLLNNHTTTDAPRTIYKEHDGNPPDQGVHTLPNHPTMVSFDNQHKMFSAAY